MIAQPKQPNRAARRQGVRAAAAEARASARGVEQIRPQEGPQEQFLASPADIVIYGGSAGGGKSYGLLLEGLRHTGNPNFGFVIFRRTSNQVRNEGGLWDQSTRLYPRVGARPLESLLEWRFPSGARGKFAHLEYDKNVLDWQGTEIPFIGFDELTHFTERQFWYMLSRNRSLCGVKPYIRATCNPVDPDDAVGGWVPKLIAWWIDEDGYPIPERGGVIRWFVRIEDKLVWAGSAEELHERYPEIPPKSLTFIPAKLTDNKALMAADPGYKANLMALPLVERERLLGGNWKIRPAAGKVFNRAWFRIVDAAPARASRRVRYWDKGGTDGDGDPTVGTRMSYHDGLYYVEDVIRDQLSSHKRETLIQQTAKLDGHLTHIWVEQEPGSGGKESAENTISDLAGYTVRADKVGKSDGDKLQRAMPLAAQAEPGNVVLVKGDWNEEWLKELHGFPDGTHDDQVDSASGAFRMLVKMMPFGFEVQGAPRPSTWAR